MNRETWLSERRASVEADYTREASTYDDGYDPITIVHPRFVERLLETVPEGGTLLDAPCGTGPYFGMQGGHVYLTVEQADRTRLQRVRRGDRGRTPRRLR